MNIADRMRLARLLGMLGSDADGEVLNAGRFADRQVRSAGLTWYDVLSLEPPDDDDTGTIKDDIATCFRVNSDVFDEWEQRFLCDIKRKRKFTAKQRALLSKLASRARWQEHTQ
jgi:hypothetical protein